MGEPASERLTHVFAAIEQATDNYALWVAAEHTGVEDDVRVSWADRVCTDLAAALPDPRDLRAAIALLVEVQGNQRGMELVNGSRAIQDPGDMEDGPWSGPCPGCPQCRPTRQGGTP